MKMGSVFEFQQLQEYLVQVRRMYVQLSPVERRVVERMLVGAELVFTIRSFQRFSAQYISLMETIFDRRDNVYMIGYSSHIAIVSKELLIFESPIHDEYMCEICGHIFDRELDYLIHVDSFTCSILNPCRYIPGLAVTGLLNKVFLERGQ